MARKTIIFFIIVACVLLGCHKTPTSTVISNNKENYTNWIAEDETTESW